jgi:hypothetical protein
MYDETSTGGKRGTARLSYFELAVGHEETGAGTLRKHPNDVWWYYHAPMILNLPQRQPLVRFSFRNGNTRKVAAERMHAFVRWRKNPKNADGL